MDSLMIAIISACVSLAVALLTAWTMRKNEIALRNRQLKEEHYTKLLAGISNAVDDTSAHDYVVARNRIWVAADENVVRALLEYEKVAKPGVDHADFEKAYTKLVQEMRKDLGIRDKNLPQLHLRSTHKPK